MNRTVNTRDSRKPDWNGKPYHSLDYMLRERFGEKVYKVTLNGGMSCPNRDGTLGNRGCIFCSQGGSGDFAADAALSITEQIDSQIAVLSAKRPIHKYIAYFQAYTNTYAPVEYLRKIFTEALRHPAIVALSIGTRPDCLGEDVLELLTGLNREKPVWVELGLQTIYPESAAYIRRGYDLPVFVAAVKNLKAMGVTVIVHQILGLPGETPEMMAAASRYIGDSGADGIKLHLLHVLRNTDLAAEWQAGRVRTLELEEYISLLELCLQNLPPEMVVHRLTGDGAKRDLLAPLWSGDKKRVLNAIHQAFRRDDLTQGSAWNAAFP